MKFHYGPTHTFTITGGRKPVHDRTKRFCGEFPSSTLIFSHQLRAFFTLDWISMYFHRRHRHDRPPSCLFFAVHRSIEIASLNHFLEYSIRSRCNLRLYPLSIERIPVDGLNYSLQQSSVAGWLQSFDFPITRTLEIRSMEICCNQVRYIRDLAGYTDWRCRAIRETFSFRSFDFLQIVILGLARCAAYINRRYQKTQQTRLKESS